MKTFKVFSILAVAFCLTFSGCDLLKPGSDQTKDNTRCPICAPSKQVTLHWVAAMDCQGVSSETNKFDFKNKIFIPVWRSNQNAVNWTEYSVTLFGYDGTTYQPLFTSPYTQINGTVPNTPMSNYWTSLADEAVKSGKTLGTLLANNPTNKFKVRYTPRITCKLCDWTETEFTCDRINVHGACAPGNTNGHLPGS